MSRRRIDVHQVFRRKERNSVDTGKGSDAFLAEILRDVHLCGHCGIDGDAVSGIFLIYSNAWSLRTRHEQHVT
jgi:hypothetical protein